MNTEMRSPWRKPTLLKHGGAAEITMSSITKTGAAGDTLTISQETIPIPGSAVVP